MAQRGARVVLDLPDVIVLTNRSQYLPQVSCPTVVTGAVRGGARAVVVREKDLPREEREDVARRCVALMRAVQGRLIVASDVSLAREVGADGVHLGADDPFPYDNERPPIVGRSCHSLDEVGAAASEGCDYVTLSPIFESASKPGYGPALGIDVLAEVCRSMSIPVFALGGVGVANARSCMDAGAAGVAVMGLVGTSADEANAAMAALGDSL